jgi:hypothetical protein
MPPLIHGTWFHFIESLLEDYDPFMPILKFMNLAIFSSEMSASTSSAIERILDLVALEPLPGLYIMLGQKQSKSS